MTLGEILFDQRSEAALLQRMCQARCWAYILHIKYEGVGCNKTVVFIPSHSWMDLWLVIFRPDWFQVLGCSVLSFGWCFRSGVSGSSPKPEPTLGCSDSTFGYQIGEPKASRNGLKVFLAAHFVHLSASLKVMNIFHVTFQTQVQTKPFPPRHWSQLRNKSTRSWPSNLPHDRMAPTFFRSTLHQVHLEQGGKENAEVERMGILEGLGWESLSTRQIWRGMP